MENAFSIVFVGSSLAVTLYGVSHAMAAKVVVLADLIEHYGHVCSQERFGLVPVSRAPSRSMQKNSNGPKDRA